MEAIKRAGRPTEGTSEEKELLVRIRNEARKKYDVETNKKHTCRFCKKDFFKHRFGSHIFNKHPEELKKMFAPFTKITSPTFPYGLPSFKPCFVCQQVWEHDGHVEAHTKKNPECSAENQLKAMYAFLGCEPPTDSITIKHNHPPVEAIQEAKDRKDENESLYKQMAQLTSRLTINNTKLNTITHEKEALEAQVESLKADLKALRVEKQRIEARDNYHKRKAYFEAELAKDKLETITTYLREADKNQDYAEQITETLEKTLTEEENAELEKLRAIAKLSDVLPPPTSDNVVPPPPVDVLPPPPPPAPEPTRNFIAQVLSIRERKQLGMYTARPTLPPAPALVNAIVEPETTHKACKICAGTDEFYDLKNCNQCNKLACADNELRGCYMIDCSKCHKDICTQCNRKNGATKLKPLCSSCL